ncbi:MAG: MerR family DNA-binding protein, partial [Anaerolineae bacterium]|nr:MerR family DNA-binding protein [Anaerolineae bacterium]
RLYGEAELLRLQQILFFKELDMPLDQIRQILDDPGFDQVAALEHHRGMLQGRVERLARLLNTVDRTLDRLTEDDMTLTDEELYEGFSTEQIERYKREAREMYDPALVEESERRVKGMSREKWQAVQAQGRDVTVAIAGLMDRDPGDPEVQAQVAGHHAWIENFYPCSAEIYRGLAQLYVEHPEFRAFYEKVRPGLAEFLSAAMVVYADQVLGQA